MEIDEKVINNILDAISKVKLAVDTVANQIEVTNRKLDTLTDALKNAPGGSRRG